MGPDVDIGLRRKILALLGKGEDVGHVRAGDIHTNVFAPHKSSVVGELLHLDVQPTYEDTCTEAVWISTWVALYHDFPRVALMPDSVRPSSFSENRVLASARDSEDAQLIVRRETFLPFQVSEQTTLSS